MPDTHILLAKVTVGAAGASSIDFTNIPQTGYTDLMLLISAKSNGTGGGENLWLRFNGDTGSNYSTRRIYGTGSSVGSDTGTTTSWINVVEINDNSANTTNTFGNSSIYIPNYTGSNAKSVSADAVAEANQTTTYYGLNAGLWTGTAAIISIKLIPQVGNLILANSTAYLYGISNVDTTPTKLPSATGGDIITNDGTYWIHTFLASGTFTPSKSLSNVDYLVVGGGGAGGTSQSSGVAGGGGAGGLRSTVGATGGGGSLESKLSLNASTNYTVTIGAGGALGGAGNRGLAGSDTTFSTITAIGGGGGGGQSQITGGSGGSGGGGNGGTGGTAGAGTANQGYAGGAGLINTGGAGGGGAGAVGTTGTDDRPKYNGKAGGAGIATSISGSSVTYAGGGGGSGDAGGAGGTGGGGTGQRFDTPAAGATAGTANTGGGGGGYANSGSGAGGSGIVIIRYAM